MIEHIRRERQSARAAHHGDLIPHTVFALARLGRLREIEIDVVLHEHVQPAIAIIVNVVRPTPGTPGNLGYQSNHLPGQANMDLSLFKAVNISERFKVQFRAEAFNLTNTPQFGAPNRIHNDPNFGRIFSTQDGTQRRTQFALRFMF